MTNQIETKIAQITAAYGYRQITEGAKNGMRAADMTQTELFAVVGSEGWLDMEGTWAKIGSYEVTVHNVAYVVTWEAWTGGRGSSCLLWQTRRK